MGYGVVVYQSPTFVFDQCETQEFGWGGAGDDVGAGGAGANVFWNWDCSVWVSLQLGFFGVWVVGIDENVAAETTGGGKSADWVGGGV